MQNKNSKKFSKPIVHVVWEDSSSRNGWGHEREYDDEAYICESVGFLMHKGKKTLSLSQSLSNHSMDTSEVINIPLVVVKKITKLQ